MSGFTLTTTMSGSRLDDMLVRALDLPAFNAEPPTELRIDRMWPPVTERWRAHVSSASTEARCNWEPDRRHLGVVRANDALILRLPEAFATAAEGRHFVEPFAFDLCSLGTVYLKQWSAADYPRWSFARSHIDHGWGCAFRGAGHDRLVSRRWLDFGPWRVIRRPNDTTFIQFHDLAITDPAEAYEQAKAGHQRMGIDPIGGFIQGIDLDVIKEVRGVYRPDDKTLDVVVAPGIEVTQQDMRVACGLRLHHKLTKPMVDRIERIAYVFVDKADAEAHLHELWLRELECWYLDERGKHRLDADYRPTPTPPAWVTALEARGDA